jgi:hypothetical protein
MQVRTWRIHEQKSFPIFENYFTSKSFVAIRESIRNAYPDRETPDKTTMHQLITKLLDILSDCGEKLVRRREVLTGEKHRKAEETLKSCLVILTSRKLKLFL